MLRESGKYIQQMEGYAAFVPSELPLQPPVEMTEEMYALMSKADRALGRLDGSIQSLPDPDLFVFMYVRKEAVLSSQIEGTQASLGDLLQVEAQIFDPKRPDDTDEILNYVRAMNYGLRRLRELPVSLRLVREIHAELMDGVRGHHATPGQFRTTQNWIGAGGVTLNDAVFVPPPPSELPRLLGNFEKYIHHNDATPLLMKLGILHAHFETLHPFLDGNGRMGRLLITFLLCEREVLLMPVLYLSHYLKRNRAEYYDRLQATRVKGDFEGWLRFFFVGVAEVANEATETVRSIVQMREDHRQRIINSMGKGAANGLKLLETLYQRPYFNVSNVCETLGMSAQGANKVTEKFVELGLVTEITGGRRNRVFFYDSYFALFGDVRPRSANSSPE